LLVVYKNIYRIERKQITDLMEMTEMSVKIRLGYKGK